VLVTVSGSNKRRCTNHRLSSIVQTVWLAPFVFCTYALSWKFSYKIMVYYSCCAVNCKNNVVSRPDLFFFNFPCYSSERFVRDAPNLMLPFSDSEVAVCTIQCCEIWDYHSGVPEGTGLSRRWANR
jgi:hypothetical protein